MKRLVFLAGSFHPDFSAVGYCAYQVQKCLVEDFDITVVAFRSRADQAREANVGPIKIRRIETPYMVRRNSLAARPGFGARSSLQALRLWGAVKRVAKPETIDASLVQAYLTALEELDEPPDAVVPLVFPFESVIAALSYKAAKPRVVVLPYLFDDFVDSGSLHVLRVLREIKRPRHLALERQMLEQSHAVLSMHPLREHFNRNFEKPLVDKIKFLEHPLLIPPPTAKLRIPSDIIRVCFAGSFIRNVRPPDYLLNLLEEMQPSSKTRVDFYVMGNDAQKVSRVASDPMLEIINHGAVSKAAAESAVARSDILINVGDLQGRQIASKIFEYISAGKPIVHIAYVRGDAVTRILDRYPLSLCIYADGTRVSQNAACFASFIEAKKDARVAFADVAALYEEALPAVTADKFRELLLSSGGAVA